MKILVTGSAGFIGYHLTKRLLADGHQVVGLDNLTHYYDVRLKLDRLAELKIDAMEIAIGKQVIHSEVPNFKFVKMDLTKEAELTELFERENFEVVFNLAAQAGVRYSLERPQAYIASNIVGFANLLEACRTYSIKHLIYASSSSVYGANTEVPFSTDNKTDMPISLYGASKKSNELMAYAYSHLYSLPTTGLRFFTVYGEWGRPDMAIMLFATSIMEGKPIKVFNYGQMTRDFTYVGDVVEGMVRVMKKPPIDESTATPAVPFKLYNIGNHAPVNLHTFIETIEQALGKTTEKIMLPLQKGDMKDTYADVTALTEDFGYYPTTSIQEGIARFANWFKDYYYS